MPSFGEKLRQEREKRKITLEQISVSTKIGTRMLQALEEDKFNQLPGGIFNKGFVRAYSRFVGLDEDQTVADYLVASGDASPVLTEPAQAEPEARQPAQAVSRLETSSDSAASRPLPWGLFAAILLAMALGLSLWSHRHQQDTKRSAPSAPQAAPQTSEGSSPQPSPPQASTSPANNRDTSESTNRRQSAPSATSTQAAPTSSPASSGKAALSVPKPPSDLTPQAPFKAGPGEFTVLVHAREDSWVAVVVDGKPRSSEVLTSGMDRAIIGRKEVVVRVGNAGAIDLRFNGKKVDFTGAYGEVKTVTVGPAGVVPTPAAPPSTPPSAP